MPRLTSITVKESFGYNHYTPAEFARVPLTDRIQMIVTHRVEFFDENGTPIAPLEAVDQLPRAGS